MGSCFSSEAPPAGQPPASQPAASTNRAPPRQPQPQPQPQAVQVVKPPSELHTKRRGSEARRQREEFELGDSGLIAARPPSSTHSRHSRRASDAEGNTQLHLAAAAGDAAAVRGLLGRRALLTATNVDGWTPLHSAASRGCAEVISLLAQGGASLEARAADGRTPLAVACQAGEERAVCILLALGADPTALDNAGSCVHAAARASEAALAAGVPAVLQALAQAGAPLNAAEPAQGRTALHLLAGRSGSAAALDILLQAGADPYIEDRAGQTPLGTALAAGNTSAVELLLLPGSRRRTEGGALSPYASAPPLPGSLPRQLQRSRSTAPAVMMAPPMPPVRPRHTHTKSM